MTTWNDYVFRGLLLYGLGLLVMISSYDVDVNSGWFLLSRFFMGLILFTIGSWLIARGVKPVR
jgi:hypothetical protein